MQPDEKAQWRRRFQECIRERGLRVTQQRSTIANVFLASRGHLNIEELHRRVKARDPRVGYATIYRTVKLLQECGLAVERDFGGGAARFEPLAEAGHHEHLICTTCGRIVEFEDPTLAERAVELERRHNFRIVSHKLEFYGECAECAGK